VPNEIVESQAIEIEPDLSYTEQPIQTLDTKERVTRRKKIKMYKILWNHHTKEEATSETEGFLQKNFPEFLMMRTSTTTRVHLRQQHLFRRHQMLLHPRRHLLLGQSLGPVQEN
jgi:hypothetical protein